jgi:hypothetical protein
MIREALALTAAALCLSGCAPAVPAASTRSEGLACIRLSEVAGRRVVAADTLLFEMAGPVDYTNRLAGSCPASRRLGPGASIALLDVGDGLLCAGERVRLFDPVEDRLAPAPNCRLGRFLPAARGARPGGR